MVPKIAYRAIGHRKCEGDCGGLDEIDRYVFGALLYKLHSVGWLEHALNLRKYRTGSIQTHLFTARKVRSLRESRKEHDEKEGTYVGTVIGLEATLQ